MDNRREELLTLCGNMDEKGKMLIGQLIDEIVFLESRLTELRRMPMLAVNPKNPAMQKQTPAAKQYKEILQQYTNCIKIMMKATGATDADEESPLQSFLRQMNEKGGAA